MTQDLTDADAPVVATTTIDVIDSLLPPAVLARVDALRRARADVRDATQASFEAIFATDDPQGLSWAERELAAHQVAVLQCEAPLARLHAERGRALGLPEEALAAASHGAAGHGDPRRQALLQFVERLTLAPFDAQPAHFEALAAQGLAPADIVTLAQLVAFVNYEVRLLAGLRALADFTDVPPGTPGLALLPGHNEAPVRHHPQVAYTTDVLQWSSWLPVVDPARANADQLAVLDESHASARTSPYYLTLVHNPVVLRHRSRLFNAIMYGRGGLPRAERELATLGVSLVNGCPYCASVHARLFAQLTHEPQVVQSLFEQGLNVRLSPRRRALLDLGVNLSANPPAGVQASVAAARDAGLSAQETLDGLHAAAIFAWANRLMQTLGEPVR